MYDIGRSKRATRAYSLDDIALIPSRRTRGTCLLYTSPSPRD